MAEISEIAKITTDKKPDEILDEVEVDGQFLKTCKEPTCRKVFTAKFKIQKFCEKKCSSKFHNRRTNEKRQQGLYPKTTPERPPAKFIRCDGPDCLNEFKEKGKKRFCSIKCSNKYAWSPEGIRRREENKQVNKELTAENEDLKKQLQEARDTIEDLTTAGFDEVIELPPPSAYEWTLEVDNIKVSSKSPIFELTFLVRRLLDSEERIVQRAGNQINTNLSNE